MHNDFLLEIFTPDKILLSKKVKSIVVVSSEGELGILYNHTPLLANLIISEMRYYDDSQKNHYIFIAGGFCEVTADKVTILAQAAELSSEIDLTRAQYARERAEKRLHNITLQQTNPSSDNAVEFLGEEVDLIRAEVALRRSLIRIKVATRNKMN